MTPVFVAKDEVNSHSFRQAIGLNRARRLQDAAQVLRRTNVPGIMRFEWPDLSETCPNNVVQWLMLNRYCLLSADMLVYMCRNKKKEEVDGHPLHRRFLGPDNKMYSYMPHDVLHDALMGFCSKAEQTHSLMCLDELQVILTPAEGTSGMHKLVEYTQANPKESFEYHVHLSIDYELFTPKTAQSVQQQGKVDVFHYVPCVYDDPESSAKLAQEAVLADSDDDGVNMAAKTAEFVAKHNIPVADVVKYLSQMHIQAPAAGQPNFRTQYHVPSSSRKA